MPDPIKDLESLRKLFPEMDTYVPEEEEVPAEEIPLLSDKEKAQMKLYVSRDKKQRGGKQVTLIQGHQGPPAVMSKLLSDLKSKCSAGGTLKEGEIIVQGDHVKKIIDYLIRSGYKHTKQKGG